MLSGVFFTYGYLSVLGEAGLQLKLIKPQEHEL